MMCYVIYVLLSYVVAAVMVIVKMKMSKVVVPAMAVCLYVCR